MEKLAKLSKNNSEDSPKVPLAAEESKKEAKPLVEDSAEEDYDDELEAPAANREKHDDEIMRFPTHLDEEGLIDPTKTEEEEDYLMSDDGE